MTTFSHLHCHTQFSLLDGAASISSLYQKAVADQMPAIAITDHGNMFGAFEFVAEAYKHKNPDGSLQVKPIVGCEFYVVRDRHAKAFTKDQNVFIRSSLLRTRLDIKISSNSPPWVTSKGCTANIPVSTKA
jgi:DNA polymerase III alpha subunit